MKPAVDPVDAEETQSPVSKGEMSGAILDSCPGHATEIPSASRQVGNPGWVLWRREEQPFFLHTLPVKMSSLRVLGATVSSAKTRGERSECRFPGDF